MKAARFSDGKEIFTRVSKAYARKNFTNERIALCPVNLRPGYPWAPHVVLPQDVKLDFDAFVADFRFYNCTSNETGYYAAFYSVTQHTAK